jgi:putative CocE/NonD family hydrolase
VPLPEGVSVKAFRAVSAAFVASILVLLLSAASVAQSDQERQLAEFIRASYTKFEYRIPMRDGARLFTAVYVPKDASASNTYPVMLTRTPYTVAPYGEDQYPEHLGPSELFTRSKYIFVYQDVRGRFMSEGEFVDMRPYIAAKNGSKDVDESSDTYDTIDWVIKNVAYNNGKVGVWGISYPGFYTAMAMIDAHPAIKAVSPQAPIADWFIGDDFHHNGALYLPHMFNFMIAFGLPRPELTTKWGPRFEHGTPDGYEFFQKVEPLTQVNDRYYHHNIAWWDQIIQHPNYDAFWKSRATLQFLRNIKPAVLTVGGWFDAEDLWGTLHTYEATNRLSPQGDVRLVMGPWCHGCWARTDGDHLGNARFNAKTSEFYRANIEFPFFEHHLKDKSDPALPKVYAFETGSNEWRRYEQWPPAAAAPATLYFGADGSLSFHPPAEGAQSFDEYVSDPAKPVPFITDTADGMTREHMTDDQRLMGRRTDVLVYQTEPLTENVTLAGPLNPELFVSTTGTDSDFVVKLIDVYPDDYPDPQPNPREVHMGAYQQLVRGELFRARFRNSYEKPEPFKPGEVTRVAYNMPDVNHTFRRGHRIMIQVQSTWFPLVDLNPQTFVQNIYEAKPQDFKKATERIYRGGNAKSNVRVMVVKK